MRRPFALPMLALIALSIGPLMLAACGDGGRRPVTADATPLIGDSAGVRILQDSVPAWGGTARWTVGEEPTLDLGAPANQFAGLGPLVRLSDGHLVVLNGVAQSIGYFDAKGKLLRTVGGRGTEPGQFHGLGWLGVGSADTVIAYDFVARHLVVFDQTGDLIRTVPIHPADPEARVEPLGVYPDGSVLFRIGAAKPGFPAKVGEVVRDSASYLRFDRVGDPVALIARVPQAQTFGVKVRPDAAVTGFPVPYGPVTSAALLGDTTLIGTGGSFEIASFGPDGQPVRLLRAAIPRAPLTEEERQAETQAALTRIRQWSQARNTPLDSTFLRALEHPPFPAEKPAFSRLVVDRTGALWVAQPVAGAALPTEWTVFGPDGAWLGTVTTPAAFRVDEIGADYLLGAWRQAHGEERVRIYPLSRGSR